MATREERFRRAAWAYFIYGVIYLLGGWYLYLQGIAVGQGRGWFVVGTLIVIIFPLLLSREFSWFDRWVLTRRDFCRILTLLVAVRAFAVGKVMLNPTIPSVPLPWGADLPMSLGAGIFFLITLATMALLSRAAWSRPE